MSPNSNQQSSVYVPMCADIIHPGHIRLLKKAASFGPVTVGLLTDKAIEDKKGRPPVMSYSERAEVLEAIRYVYSIIPKTESRYEPQISQLQPSFIVHGNDWSKSIQNEITRLLSTWDGKLILVNYDDYSGSSTAIKSRVVRTP